MGHEWQILSSFALVFALSESSCCSWLGKEAAAWHHHSHFTIVCVCHVCVALFTSDHNATGNVYQILLWRLSISPVCLFLTLNLIGSYHHGIDLIIMIDAVHVGNADFCSPISHYFQFIAVQGDTFSFVECPDACRFVFQMFFQCCL